MFSLKLIAFFAFLFLYYIFLFLGTAAWSQLHVLGMVLLHFEAHKRLASGALERKVRSFAICTYCKIQLYNINGLAMIAVMNLNLVYIHEFNVKDFMLFSCRKLL